VIGRTWVGSEMKVSCRGCGTAIRTRAPGWQIRYSSVMIARNTLGSCPRCSREWMKATSSAQSSGQGQGVRSRSQTSSGSQPAQASTLWKPSSFLRPQPMLKRMQRSMA
jgi:hypothetical protein